MAHYYGQMPVNAPAPTPVYMNWHDGAISVGGVDVTGQLTAYPVDPSKGGFYRPARQVDLQAMHIEINELLQLAAMLQQQQRQATYPTGGFAPPKKPYAGHFGLNPAASGPAEAPVPTPADNCPAPAPPAQAQQGRAAPKKAPSARRKAYRLASQEKTRYVAKYLRKLRTGTATDAMRAFTAAASGLTGHAPKARCEAAAKILGLEIHWGNSVTSIPQLVNGHAGRPLPMRRDAHPLLWSKIADYEALSEEEEEE